MMYEEETSQESSKSLINEEDTENSEMVDESSHESLNVFFRFSRPSSL